MNQSPPIIGLAGGIGSGKSAVAALLEELGCVVFRADRVAKEALNDPDIRQQIVSRWGDLLIDDSDWVDTRAIADIVFVDARERKWLENIVHPWVEQRRREYFSQAPPNTPALVIDAPLLYEAKLNELCGAVIFVDTPPHTRLKRLQQTRQWTEEELQRREDCQFPLDEKRTRADYVIENHGDMQFLRQQVHRIFNQITSPA